MLVNVFLMLSVICSFILTAAWWFGLKLNVIDPKCQDEIKEVKRNINSTKWILTFITIFSIVAMIMFNVMFEIYI